MSTTTRTTRESTAHLFLSYFDESSYYELKEVKGPWEPVPSKALRTLIDNLCKKSQVVNDGENTVEIIEKWDLETAFAISGLPFYEGEELPFDFADEYQAFLLQDVFYVLDLFLEDNLEYTYSSTALCWAKKPTDEVEGICLGPASAMLNPDLPKIRVEYNRSLASKAELTREESLVALKNMALFNSHLRTDEVEFLLTLDLPKNLVAILSDKTSYNIPEHTLSLKGAVSEEYFNQACAENIGLDTEVLLQKILEAFN